MTDVFLIEDLGQQRLQARTLVSALRAAGLSARLVDCGPNHDPERIIGLVRADSPRWIVFSVLFAHLLDAYLALAVRLRAAVPTVRLALAGPLPALARDELSAACMVIDAVLQGNLATAVVEMAVGDRAARSGALASAESFLHPARDDGIPEWLGVGYVPIEGSRGCWHRCTFCLPRAFYRAQPGPDYRLRSVSDLVAEIGSLYARGARLFLFDDEQFLPPRGRREVRVRELTDALERERLAIAFTAKLRPDDVDPELCRELQAAGLIRVYLGVESGGRATLDLLGKGVTPEDNLRALATLDDLGIIADFRMLMFHPWATPESLRTDLDFLRQALPCTSTLFAYREIELYPGTLLAERFGAEVRSRPGLLPRPYIILDPQAELIRRLGRLVFGPRDAPGGLHDRLTSAWFDVLVQRRFGSGDGAACAAALTRLRAEVARLNAGSLDVWAEMLDFAARADIRNAGAVNQRAVAWAGRVAALDL